MTPAPHPPPTTDWDVVVVGGGSAGLAAAIAAAGLGAKTCLVERHGFAGGMATAALVHSICGLYRLTSRGPGAPANPGFASHFARRLLQSGGASGPIRLGRVEVLFHQPPAFAVLADSFLTNTKNLTVKFHTEGIAAPPSLEALEILCRGVRETLRPRMVVDATGDAALAALVGADCEIAASDRLQRPAYICRLEGLPAAALDENGRLRLARSIAHGVHSKQLTPAALAVTFRAIPNDGGLFATFNLEDPKGWDPLDPDGLTRLEILGRQLAREVTAYLAANGWDTLRVAAHPVRAGLRESRRLVGRQRVETADLATGSLPDDSVALATWPRELRERAQKMTLKFPEDNRPCGIPLGALQSRNRPNLLAAGRCLSCSHEAQASLRVIGTCLATGEAAGIAAALTADTGDEPTAATIAEKRQHLLLHEYR